MSVAQRAAFVHSLTVGQTVIEYEPNGKAAQEIKELCMFACQHANMQASEDRRKSA